MNLNQVNENRIEIFSMDENRQNIAQLCTSYLLAFYTSLLTVLGGITFVERAPLLLVHL
jgi:hypothetical protein